MSLIEIKILIVYYLFLFDSEINNDVVLWFEEGFTIHPINDSLIKLKPIINSD